MKCCGCLSIVRIVHGVAFSCQLHVKNEQRKHDKSVGDERIIGQGIHWLRHEGVCGGCGSVRGTGNGKVLVVVYSWDLVAYFFTIVGLSFVSFPNAIGLSFPGFFRCEVSYQAPYYKAQDCQAKICFRVRRSAAEVGFKPIQNVRFHWLVRVVLFLGQTVVDVSIGLVGRNYDLMLCPWVEVGVLCISIIIICND